MGYYVYITRMSFGAESEETLISIDEWRKYIDNDSELKINPTYNHRDDELEVFWFGEGGVSDDSEGVGWFCWGDGQINTKNPDHAHLRKMCQMASLLDARVLGEEGEEYRVNGEIWENKYVDNPPGVFKRLWSCYTGKPLPERKSDWVMTGRWD